MEGTREGKRGKLISNPNFEREQRLALSIAHGLVLVVV